MSRIVNQTKNRTKAFEKVHPSLIMNWMEGVDLLMDMPGEPRFWQGCSLCCGMELLDTKAALPFLVGLLLLKEKVWFERSLTGAQSNGGDKVEIQEWLNHLVMKMRL
jgi:hypothetical protein